MSNFEDLVTTVEAYQARATENYDRIRHLAEKLKEGFCEYLSANDGVCVHLVPPVGPFKPFTDLNKAFSIPPRGFRPLGPVYFGLAMRVSRGTDWIRIVMRCHKLGEKFTVYIENGPSYTFHLPLAESDMGEFFDLLFSHVREQFTEEIERYDRGSEARSIGFDFSDDSDDKVS